MLVDGGDVVVILKILLGLFLTGVGSVLQQRFY